MFAFWPLSGSLYYLYVLYSERISKYYIGISRDPEKRLSYHNSANKGWTRRGRPWKLVYIQGFIDEKSAHKAEKFVKSQKSKKFIEKVVSGKYII